MFEKNAAANKISLFGNHDRIGDISECQCVSGCQRAVNHDSAMQREVERGKT